MKKIVLTLGILFFWTLFFPPLSLNSFTTDILDSNLDYDDLFHPDKRAKILENAEFDYWFWKK